MEEKKYKVQGHSGKKMGIGIYLADNGAYQEPRGKYVWSVHLYIGST